jgi:transposase-like protein
MAIKVNFKNNTTDYVGGYAKINKLEDDSINRIAKVQVAFFQSEKESHSENRIVMVDEFTFDGDDYTEIFQGYDEANIPKAVTYEKVQTKYMEKWSGVEKKQQELDGKEVPYRETIIKEKQPMDEAFEVAGTEYKADPTSEPKKAVAQETYMTTRDFQLERSDVLFGANDEYPDAPVKWSLDFDVALTEIPA